MIRINWELIFKFYQIHHINFANSECFIDRTIQKVNVKLDMKNQLKSDDFIHEVNNCNTATGNLVFVLKHTIGDNEPKKYVIPIYTGPK